MSPDKIHVEGIRNVTPRDIQDADRSGYALRLLGVAERAVDGAYIFVCPFFVKKDCLLAGVKGVTNGIRVVGNAVGELHFTGAGAGKLPTASALVCDVMDAVGGDPSDNKNRAEWKKDVSEDFLKDFSERRGRTYLRFASVSESAAALLGAEIITPDALITSEFSESELDAILEKNSLKPISRIRVF